MFTWAERTSIPHYNHEMLHYRNALVKEINFVFSDRYDKFRSDSTLQDEFEQYKDFREKTGNRVQNDSDRNKVWLELLMDLFHSSLDFTAADLYLKYFNIPNEAVSADLYFIMKETDSIYNQLIQDESFNTAYEFLHFFPASDRLQEFENLLRAAIKKRNNSAVLFLVDNISTEPYDRLLKDEDTKSLLEKEYDKAESERRIVAARKLADVLKDSDRAKRIRALEAMMNNNVTDAISRLKEIRNISGFKPIIKEFYSNAMKKGKKNSDMEQFKVAFNYAFYGKLSENGDKKFIQEPAGKLFEYYVLKPGATEIDFFEADRYRSDCSERHVQDVVAKKMLFYIQNNDRAMAKHMKERFKAKFIPGDYKSEEDIRKFFYNLTETYGSFEVPKGEENLLTALDIAELFNFHQEEIEGVKVLLCKFFIMNKIFESAKTYYIASNNELNELIVKQVSIFVGTRDFNGAYGLIEAIPIKISRQERAARKSDLKGLIGIVDSTLGDVAMAIILDDVYDLRTLVRSYYHRAFIRGLESGQEGIQFLVDLSRPFKKNMDACGKIKLTNTIRRLITEDRISADILNRTFEEYVHSDIIDYIMYFFKKLFGLC